MSWRGVDEPDNPLDRFATVANGVAPQEHEKQEEKSSTSQNPAALSASSHALQIADMIRAIREDGTPLVDGYAGRHPVEIILSIHESVRTHCVHIRR